MMVILKKPVVEVIKKRQDVDISDAEKKVKMLQKYVKWREIIF